MSILLLLKMMRNKVEEEDEKEEEIEEVEEKPIIEYKEHRPYITGFNDGSFKPYEKVSRAEVAMMIARIESKSMNIPKTSDVHYNDVNVDDWYYNAVALMHNKGIISGYSDGSFKPNEPISRAELASIIARYRSTLGVGRLVVFNDVSQNHWAYNSINYAASHDWIKGYPNGNFKPDKAITRGEAVSMINRMLDRKPDLSYISSHQDIQALFNDISGHWAFADIIDATTQHGYYLNEDGSQKWNYAK